MRRRRRVVTTLAACLGAAAAGCGGTAANPQLAVTPAQGLWDVPAVVRLTGLRPRQAVTVRATTVDRAGVRWTAAARFAADPHGVVDLGRDAPTGGDYRGAEVSGLVTALQPSRETPTFFPADASERIRFDAVVGGRVVGSQTVVRRTLGADVRVQDLSVAVNGFDGDYFEPPSGRGARPSVLLIADAAGLPAITALEASLLASHGFPTLAVAYYGAPGLPANLERIPLEYFILPLRFLRSRPEVDRSRVVAFGTYRGSEAALLLGARYTDLVHGVIALAPSAVLNPAYDTTSQFNVDAPAWTVGDEPLRSIHGLVGDPAPTGADRAAIIPVARIRGPVLTASARRDYAWTEWANAVAIQARLDAAHDAYPHANADYPDAEAAVVRPVPGIALGQGRAALVDPGVDARARRDLWRRILRFLAQLPVSA